MTALMNDIQSYDLAALVERDTHLARKTRGEWAGACPQCGGRDRFLVKPEGGRDGRGIWTCRSCRNFEWSDAIGYALWRGFAHDFRGACAALRLDIADRDERIVEPPPPEPCEPPSAAWQARAGELGEAAVEALWSDDGARAREWLARRGYTEATLLAAGLGFNPRDVFDEPDVWDLPVQHARVYTPRGITIPWLIDGAIWRLNVRRALTSAQQAAGEAKYRGPAGNSNGLWGAGRLASGRPAVIVEGEFDALAVWQEARDLVTPVALGSTSGARRMRWMTMLAPLPLVLVATDNDGQAGEQAADYWIDALGATARRWRPYTKDCGQMLQEGMSVRAWVEAGLEANQ